ncbi:MAG: AAA family ATPase [Planctomycetota bacterium]
MSTSLDRLTIHGFKSIRALDNFELRPLNVLISANGAGKSNFVDFFRMLRAFVDEALQANFVRMHDPEGLFFLGPKVTASLIGRLRFGENLYEFTLVPSTGGRVFIESERAQYTGAGGHAPLKALATGGFESVLKARRNEPSASGAPHGVPWHVFSAISSWTVYHFHDTSFLAPMRREQSLHDNLQLRPDASNIAAWLYAQREQSEDLYTLIRDTVRLAAPFLDDFLLRPRMRGQNEMIALECTQRGSDFPFQAHQLSDGTLRLICLTATLMQAEMPSAIIIDEPELGLHPVALGIVADLIRAAAARTQVIVATQSPTLLDYFEAEDVIVVDREGNESVFRRLDAPSLAEWLQDYSFGELWQKNVFDGGPHA